MDIFGLVEFLKWRSFIFNEREMFGLAWLNVIMEFPVKWKMLV
jgi:hypothetical protein